MGPLPTRESGPEPEPEHPPQSPAIHPSIPPSINLPSTIHHPCIHPSLHPSVHQLPIIHASIHPSLPSPIIRPSIIRLPIWPLSTHPAMHMFIHPLTHTVIIFHPPAHLPSHHPSIYPSICPFVHPPTHPLPPLACPLGVSYNDVSVSTSLCHSHTHTWPCCCSQALWGDIPQSPRSAVVGGLSGTCDIQHADPPFLLKIIRSLGGGGLRGAMGPNPEEGKGLLAGVTRRPAVCPSLAPAPLTTAP